MLYPFLGQEPHIPTSCFVAASADVIGDVTLMELSSIWFNVTIRGDVNWIRIGSSTNIQDNSMVHVTRQTAPTTIGDRVTIGHAAVIHGCTIEDDVLVGVGAIILDGVTVGSGSMIGAGAVVPPGVSIPPDSVVLGTPGKVVRETTPEERVMIRQNAENYVHYRAIYLGLERPDSNPFYRK